MAELKLVGFDVGGTLMESLAQELRQESSSINTTTVVPFMVNTGLFQGAKVRFVQQVTGHKGA